MEEAQTRSPEQRKAQLARTVANWVRDGWRVEAQQDFQAVLAKGHRPNQLLHLLLTILTLGLWAIVWVIVVLTGGGKRAVLEVDEYGNILTQH